jgi:hypothetical protein
VSQNLSTNASLIVRLAVERDNNRRNGQMDLANRTQVRIDARCQSVTIEECEDVFIKQVCPNNCK